MFPSGSNSPKACFPSSNTQRLHVPVVCSGGGSLDCLPGCADQQPDKSRELPVSYINGAGFSNVFLRYGVLTWRTSGVNLRRFGNPVVNGWDGGGLLQGGNQIGPAGRQSDIAVRGTGHVLLVTHFELLSSNAGLTGVQFFSTSG